MGCRRLTYYQNLIELKVVGSEKELTLKSSAKKERSYLKARYYAPWLCRFISCDPMKEARAWLTPYNYVQNNPINLTDPTGALDDGGGDEPKGGNQQNENSQGSNETTKKTQVHSVKSGETLSKIADKYGTTVEAISEANNISDPNKIQVGQKLNIGGTSTGSDNLSETFDFSSLIAQPDNTRVVTPMIPDLTPVAEDSGSNGKGMFVSPTGGSLRGQDKHGSGHYGASRSGGAREHKGIDIESKVGQDIVSPVSGTARNYTGASSKLPMVDIVPSDTSLDIQLIRMLYVNAPEGQSSGSYKVKAGEKIGTQADLGKLGYPKDIVPHVHLQTDSSGIWSNPTRFFFP